MSGPRLPINEMPNSQSSSIYPILQRPPQMSKPASFALPSDPSLFSDLDQVDNNQSGVSSIPPQRSQLAPFTTPLGVDPSAPNYNGLVEQYRTKLTEMKARLGVSTQPILKGAVFEIPVYFSDAYGSQPRVDEAKRPLPTFVTTSPYFRVQLASPIVRWRSDPESDRLSSEVWRGLMSPRQSLLGTNTPTMKVVVKFLQPSLFYLPLHPWSTNPDHQARKEAGGYDHLVSLQGSVIPYFFGKHIVSTFNSNFDVGPDHSSRCSGCYSQRRAGMGSCN